MKRSIKSFWISCVRASFKRSPLYPAPVPLPHTRSFWLTTLFVAALAALFSSYFIFYLTTLHNAYLTHAEDFGIMDQALWTSSHGQLLHQTICNILSDTNCAGSAGISRFALHFEPILFILLLSYAIAPDPKILLVVQIVVVGCGAFPAFWLARLRLRSEWAGVVIAVFYLLYPALQLAVIDAFHAVTFTSAFLLFLLYFMYTRRTGWLFVFAILAMACKEEIPAVVALCGLWSLVFQHRWRSGLELIALAFLWLGVALCVMHAASPTGQSLLATRYSPAGQGFAAFVPLLLVHPRTILSEHVLEPTHLMYVRTLLAPTGYIVLLVPWVLCLAIPSLALNLLSSNKQMYSGLFQYNAEIVPILIFAQIEAMVLILAASRLVLRHVRRRCVAARGAMLLPARFPLAAPVPRWHVPGHAVLLMSMLCVLAFTMYRADVARGVMPFSSGFSWPQASSHTRLASSFLQLIPPTASVSAQSALVPHVSQRRAIFLFPYQDTQVDYVFLDVTSEVYPFWSSLDYIREAKRVVLSGNYGILAARDGYILLKRGLPATVVSAFSIGELPGMIDPGLLLPALPARFCSYVRAEPDEIKQPTQGIFALPGDPLSRMELVGYEVEAPRTVSITAGYMSVTTYWRLTMPMDIPVQVVMLLTDKGGGEHFLSADVPSVYWCQTNTWHAGAIMRLRSEVFGLHDLNLTPGPGYLSLALVPLSLSADKIMDTQMRLPLQPAQSTALVTFTTSTNNTISLMPLTLTA
ncbi:MAG: hypothetical protein NVSMB44_16540 [Ktedonobacteraceae bacterium]